MCRYNVVLTIQGCHVLHLTSQYLQCFFFRTIISAINAILLDEESVTTASWATRPRLQRHLLWLSEVCSDFLQHLYVYRHMSIQSPSTLSYHGICPAHRIRCSNPCGVFITVTIELWFDLRPLLTISGRQLVLITT